MDIEQVTAGVDWFSATADYPSDVYQFLRKEGLICLNDVEEMGYKKVERGMNGYTGVSCGNCFLGIREDGLMLQFTGVHAHTAFRNVYHFEARVPRIDVQVTVRYVNMPRDIARGIYETTSEWAETVPKHMRTKVLLYTGNDGGDTVYVGSPSSEQRGRVYNKEVQSEDPLFVKTWRWEVTYKNKHAHRVASAIYRSGGSYTSICRGIVANWFTKRGAKPEWADMIDMVEIEPEPSLPTDVDRKLRWLEKQVAPTITYLLSRGYHDTILATLGLSSPPE